MILFLAEIRRKPEEDSILRSNKYIAEQMGQQVNDQVSALAVDKLDGRVTINLFAKKNVDLSRIFYKNYGVFGRCVLDGKTVDAEALHNARPSWEKAITEIEGGWCFMNFDEAVGNIIVCRDPFGMQAVFYSKKQDRILIANKISLLVFSGACSKECNPNKTARYASQNFRSNYGGEDTMFNDVSMLPAASCLSVDRDNQFSSQKYWDLSANEPYYNQSEKEITEIYKYGVIDSIRRTHDSLAHSNYCLALSGGIDANEIIASLNLIHGGKTPSITLSYEEDTDYDESYLTSLAADRYADPWKNVKVSAGELASDLLRLYKRYDHPISTVSYYGYDYLFRRAAEMGYKTIVTGGSGDASVAGNYPFYLHYFADLQAEGNIAKYETEVSTWIRNQGTDLHPKTFETVEKFFEQSIDFSKKGELKPHIRNLAGEMLDCEFKKKAGNLDCQIEGNYGSYVRSLTMQEYYRDIAPGGAEADSTMEWLYSVGITSPFLDRKMATIGWKIPTPLKIKYGKNKIIAKNAFRGLIPDEILGKVTKSGFNAPFDIWARGELKPLLMDTFNSKSFQDRGIYEIKCFKSALEEHMEGSRNHMMLLWQALNLELWMQAWVDN